MPLDAEHPEALAAEITGAALAGNLLEVLESDDSLVSRLMRRFQPSPDAPPGTFHEIDCTVSGRWAIRRVGVRRARDGSAIRDRLAVGFNWEPDAQWRWQIRGDNWAPDELADDDDDLDVIE